MAWNWWNQRGNKQQLDSNKFKVFDWLYCSIFHVQEFEAQIPGLFIGPSSARPFCVIGRDVIHPRAMSLLRPSAIADLQPSTMCVSPAITNIVFQCRIMAGCGVCSCGSVHQHVAAVIDGAWLHFVSTPLFRPTAKGQQMLVFNALQGPAVRPRRGLCLRRLPALPHGKKR